MDKSQITMLTFTNAQVRLCKPTAIMWANTSIVYQINSTQLRNLTQPSRPFLELMRSDMSQAAFLLRCGASVLLNRISLLIVCPCHVLIHYRCVCEWWAVIGINYFPPASLFRFLIKHQLSPVLLELGTVDLVPRTPFVATVCFGSSQSLTVWIPPWSDCARANQVIPCGPQGSPITPHSRPTEAGSAS